jgi:hypothetical protein
MRIYLNFLILFLLLIASILLIPLEMKLLGWILLGVTIVLLLFCEKKFKRDMLLVILALGLLGITSINTDLGFSHMLEISVTLFLTVALPYFITRRWYKEDTIRFPFHHGRNWYRSEILYIVITAVLAYFVFPFYMSNTGSYHNWTVKLDSASLGALFLGTNGMGGWDEFFFVSTILALFKKHFPFNVANASQAIIFTSFLFALGFRGWAPLFIYPFALVQGYIFKKTDSLLYVITIHLVLDFILYLVLIHSYYPNVLKIFIT